MLHPQVICKGFEWMAAIPRRCPELEDLFWVPTPDDADLITGTVILTDVRVLSRWPKATLLKALLFHAQQCLERLTGFGLNFGGILRTVGDFQRSLLDCRGLGDYVDIFYPRTNPNNAEELAKVWPVDNTRYGGFTHDPQVAQLFHKVGLPIRWIRPDFAVNLSNTKVWSNARHTHMSVDWNIVTEDHYLPFGAKEPVFPVLYQGAPGTDLQLQTQKIAARVFDMREPSKIALEKMAQKAVVVAPRPEQEGAFAIVCSTRSTDSFVLVTIYSLPPMSGASPLTSLPLDLAPAPVRYLSNAASATAPLPPAHEAKPPEIPSWAEALTIPRGTDKKKVRSPAYFGYTVPDYRIITNAANPQTMAEYAATWAASRVVHIHNWVEGKDMGVINRDDWRHYLKSILGYLMVDPGEVGAMAPATGSRDSVSQPSSSSANHQRNEGSPPPVPSSLPPSMPRKPPRRLPPYMRSSLAPPRPSFLPASSSSPSTVPSPSNAPRSMPNKNDKRPAQSSGTDDREKKRSRRDKDVEKYKNPYLSGLLEMAGPVEQIILFEQAVTLGRREDLVGVMTVDKIADLVWEMRTIGFRQELLITDQHLASQYWPPTKDVDDLDIKSANAATRAEREMEIRAVFSRGGDSGVGPLLPMEIPNVDEGLASFDWRERHAALIRLRNIMLQWDGCPAYVKELNTSPTEMATVRLEAAVTKYYCDAFFDTFGRIPITPCRLPWRARTREMAVRTFGSLGSKSPISF